MTTPTTAARLHDYLVSLVRTWIPIGWGALLAWLLGRGIIGPDTAAAADGVGVQLAMLLAVVAGWMFYALVRAVEPLLARHPAGRLLLRLLLGSTQQPAYPTTRDRQLSDAYRAGLTGRRP